MKTQEYELLSEIEQDPLVTQASLSVRLGMAVGSVNWYIKRLVSRGYVKVSRLDRTRLRYDLTPEGMSVLTQRALQYMKSSLNVYVELRKKSKVIVADLKEKGISQVYIDGNDEMMDILRLTCIEAEIKIDKEPGEVVLAKEGQEFILVE
ncbi:MAG: winged helix-turn-helix transcriptional regulator [Anaerolineales bacterium]|nr:winged helix-turn-helix transcriptional regulator [Anaerolineales bacterium]